MKSRFPRLLYLICLATLTLTACSQQAQQMNTSAERLLTAVAEETPGAAETAQANTSRTPAPAGPTATMEPPIVFARCITRTETQMRLEPNESASATASLQLREFITAYGRTPDTKWILGWNKEIAYGWITSGVLGCTAPFEELKPTDATILLITPTPGITTAQTQTAEPSVVSPITATLAVPAATETSLPVATSLPTASDTPLPATQAPPTPSATALPATDTPVPATTLPTASATSTSAPTATTQPPTSLPTATTTATSAPATATVAPTSPPTATSLPTASALPQVTVIVRVITVTVIVTVTAPPATPLAPAATTTPTPASTPTTEHTAVPAITITASPAAVRELACEVTPGTAVNLRRGPSRTAQLLGSLRPGATFVATGRNENDTWLYGATQLRTFGWLIATSVRCQGELNGLPVVDQ